MKRINYLAPLLLAVSAHAGLTEWQAAVSADNPRNWYRFDETSGATLVDHGSGGLSGEYIEVTINQTGLFGAGQAANFAGQPDLDDLVQMADDWADQSITGDWTAEFIVNKAAAGEGISQALFNGAATSVRLEQWNSFNVYGDYRGGVTQYGVADYYLEGTVAPPDEWSHMVFVRSGGQTFIYLNGVHRGSMDASVNLELQTISRSNANGEADKLHALLDEAIVYNRALTPNQVAAHFATTGITPPAVAPSITSQPQSQSIIIGTPDATATFSVVAAGTLPLDFQWKLNDEDIVGANSDTLELGGVTSANGGVYTVSVSNGAGTELSAGATLSIDAPPFNEGDNQTVLNGFPATLSVTLPDVTGYTFEWTKNGSVLAEEIESSLNIASVTQADSGAYSLKISFGEDTAIAGPSQLLVPATPTVAYSEAVLASGPFSYYRLGEATGAISMDDELGLLSGVYFLEVENQMPGALLGDLNASSGFQGTVESKGESYPFTEFSTPLFTVELWAKRTGGAGTFTSPITFRDFRADPAYRAGWTFYATDANNWQFRIGDGSDAWVIIDGPAVVDGEWTQLVGTYDGSTMAFYINGALAGRLEATYAPIDPMQVAPTLRIGGGQTEDPNGSFFFIGALDEVAIYDKALSAGDVAAHYAAAFDPSVAPIIVQQPQSAEVVAGGSVGLSVEVQTGTVASYQWMKDGAPIAGATDSMLMITSADASVAATYSVEIANAAGSALSEDAVVSVVGPEATYLDTVMRDAPAGYWRLDEASGTTAADASGNHDGEYRNGVILGEPGALADDDNTAARFTQADSTFVEVPWSADLNTLEFTFECWAKVTGGSGHRSPLTSRGDGPQEGYIFYADPNDNWQFWNGTGAGWSNLGGASVQNDVWVYLAGTFDGTVKRFYVNGELVGTFEPAFAPNDQDVLRIGAGATESETGNYFFEGLIDEAAVYDYALSGARIQTHYMAARPAAPMIAIAIDGGEVALSWDGAARLEQASSVAGPWTTVEGATSPHRVTPSEAQLFWRLATP